MQHLILKTHLASLAVEPPGDNPAEPHSPVPLAQAAPKLLTARVELVWREASLLPAHFHRNASMRGAVQEAGGGSNRSSFDSRLEQDLQRVSNETIAQAVSFASRDGAAGEQESSPVARVA